MRTFNFFSLCAVSPICITSSVMVIGSSLDESVTVPCRVAGDPSVITFEWTFANSGERFDVTANGSPAVGSDESAVAAIANIESNGHQQHHGVGGPFDYSDATSNSGKFCLSSSLFLMTFC